MKIFNKIMQKILNANDTSLALSYAPCYAYILSTLKKDIKVNLENYNASMSKESQKLLTSLTLDENELLKKQISFTNLALGISYESKEKNTEEKLEEFKKEIYNILKILIKQDITVLSVDIYTVATKDEKLAFSYKCNPLVLPRKEEQVEKIDLTKNIDIIKL